ncbi:MAG: phosphoribosylformylglycinamidine cyclo-ligase [Acidimicrobiia bacterium]|nr:phosphoribosylformylglycinamidine cyclo-ligase [Acidimicrobiia bacterium]
MATYKDAGVDLDAADEAVDRMRAHVTATWGDDVVGGFGGFAAGIKIPAGYREPVLMMSTDGVGTKAEVARRAGLFDGVGWDLVAMCADDLAAAGARPLAMTDYLAVGKLDPTWVERIVASVAGACAAGAIALIGGETAEHPGVMDADEFDLAGAVVGIVEADSVIDGSGVEPGQAVLGLHSPNLRSNGFSLIRSAVLPKINLDEPLTDGPAAEVFLAGSVLYSPAVQRLLATVRVAGMAHVTGGGIAGNLSRVLPPGVDAEIDSTSWNRPPVFEEVATIGGVDAVSMFQTFNMGIGFILIVDQSEVAAAQAAIEIETSVIGMTVNGSGAVQISP